MPIENRTLKNKDSDQFQNQGRSQFSSGTTVALVSIIVLFFIFSLLAIRTGRKRGIPWAFRGGFFLFCINIAFLLYLYGDFISERCISYFLFPSSPINLSIFRIVITGYLLFFVDYSEVFTFSKFPKALQFPPFGMNLVISNIPVNEQWAAAGIIIFKLFCLFSLLGFYTRISTLLAGITGIYVLGIPQLFGKVNHYHHLIWFLFILGTSRSGDVFSIDALQYGASSNRYSFLHPLHARKEVRYGFPIRVIWLLIGIIYFFPGLYKVIDSGYSYVFGNHLKLIMYHRWAILSSWTPPMRVDKYPLIYRTASFLVILFEVTFVFLLFKRTWRWIAIFSGLLFHFFSFVFLKIGFFSLVICYTVFVNWKAVFNLFAGVEQKSPENEKTNAEDNPSNLHVPQKLSKLTENAGPLLLSTSLLLIIINASFGLWSNTHAWPFACYPTFSGKPKKEKEFFSMNISTKSGKNVSVKESTIGKSIGKPRFRGLLQKIRRIEDPELRKRKYQVLAKHLVKQLNLKEQVIKLEVFLIRRSIVPEQSDNNLPTKTKITEVYL